MFFKKSTVLVLGGDGYLGWSLGLAFAHRTDLKVVLVDNLVKRQWEREVNAKPLVPLKGPQARIAEYTRIFGRNNLSFEKVDLVDAQATARLIKKYRPFAIINAAQQPSAPFSMMNAKNAAATFANNIIGNINVLWAIAETDKAIKYLKLGSAGCYAGIDTDYVPLKKVDLQFKYRGKTRHLLQSWLPMYATDFYHQSKITDFLTNELAANVWGLKVLTVQQSTIFGATITENISPEHQGLSARFNYDAVFSTVLNRFVCQIAIGHPLTVYGAGEQRTGLVSLADTVQNFLNFTERRIKNGEHVIAHNYTFRLSINEIAETLAKVAGAAKVMHIKNPRKEEAGKLKREVEVDSIVRATHIGKQGKLQRELSDFLEFTERFKKNIDPSIIMPKVSWVK